jgi:hypothetical protein
MNQVKESLSPELNREQVFQSGEGTGKSGSFFFFSHDKRFIIKTMTSSELSTFLRIQDAYLNHLNENPNSLLVKIFGVFTLYPQGMGKVHVMLMENTL